jgi:site-specific DNA recombinase
MKYFIYCRKSSEDEERQALSIESQLQELRQYASKNKLTIVQEFTESKSAKKPGRELFNQMLEEIETGKADGILAWQPDRLSRNSVCGGKIIYLIDQGVIKDLKFPSYHFENTPHGKFNLSIAFGFSKMFIDRLSEDVKRGIREKVRRGEFPGPAPQGYINNLRTHKIEADPVLFNPVKELIEKYADNEIELPEIRNKLFQAGAKAKTGNPLSYSTIKRMLMNPFYTGVFKLKGELYPGTHPQMISKSTFTKIQKRLERQPRKVDWSKKTKNEKNFLFKDLAKCGECGYSITHEFHKKESGKTFKYYRCTHRSKTQECTQLSYLREEDLAEQVKVLADLISIPDRWYERFKIQNEEEKQVELKSQQINLKNKEEELTATEKMLEILLDLRLEGEISTEEYKLKKNSLINKQAELKAQIEEISKHGSSRFEPMLEFLEIAHRAYRSVQQNDFIEMKKILQKTSLNSSILNKKLEINFLSPFHLLTKVRLQTESDSSHDKLNLNSTQQTQVKSAIADVSRRHSLMPHQHSTGCEPRSGEQCEACVASRAYWVPMSEMSDAKWQGMRDSNPSSQNCFAILLLTTGDSVNIINNRLVSPSCHAS